MSRVDIVVPLYNYGRYLPYCLESALSQDIRELRVLVIDNASTDNGLAVAQRYAERDSRVNILARPMNLGPHASLNSGIEWARAPYTMTLCADDVLAPGALRRAIAFMEYAKDSVFAFGTEIEWKGEGPPSAQASAVPTTVEWRRLTGTEYILDRCKDPMRNHAMGTILVRTDPLKRCGHYRSEVACSPDIEMMLRLAQFGTVGVSSALQGFRRLHDANFSNNFISTRLSELTHRQEAFESFFDNEGTQRDDVETLRGLMKRGLASSAFWWAVRASFRGNAPDAKELFRFAARMDASVFALPPVRHLLRENGSIPKALTGAKHRLISRFATSDKNVRSSTPA